MLRFYDVKEPAMIPDEQADINPNQNTSQNETTKTVGSNENNDIDKTLSEERMTKPSSHQATSQVS